MTTPFTAKEREHIADRELAIARARAYLRWFNQLHGEDTRPPRVDLLIPRQGE